MMTEPHAPARTVRRSVQRLDHCRQSSHPSDVLKKTAASDASHGSGGGANGGGGGADGGGGGGGERRAPNSDGGDFDPFERREVDRAFRVGPFLQVVDEVVGQSAAVGTVPISSVSMMRRPR